MKKKKIFFIIYKNIYSRFFITPVHTLIEAILALANSVDFQLVRASDF